MDNPETPTTHLNPWTNLPLFGKVIGYGTSERPTRKCSICSSRDSWTLVTLDALDYHHARHVQDYKDSLPLAK